MSTQAFPPWKIKSKEDEPKSLYIFRLHKKKNLGSLRDLLACRNLWHAEVQTLGDSSPSQAALFLEFFAPWVLRFFCSSHWAHFFSEKRMKQNQKENQKGNHAQPVQSEWNWRFLPWVYFGQKKPCTNNLLHLHLCRSPHIGSAEFGSASPCVEISCALQIFWHELPLSVANMRQRSTDRTEQGHFWQVSGWSGVCIHGDTATKKALSLDGLPRRLQMNFYDPGVSCVCVCGGAVLDRRFLQRQPTKQTWILPLFWIDLDQHLFAVHVDESSSFFESDKWKDDRISLSLTHTHTHTQRVMTVLVWDLKKEARSRV